MERNNDLTHQMRKAKAKAIYSEFTVARESGTITCVLTKTQRQAVEWESLLLSEKRGRLHVCPDKRLLSWGSSRQDNQKHGILCD